MARADRLDDMIATLRSGGRINPNRLGHNIFKELKGDPDPSDAYSVALANLYIREIKLSIVDPDTQGGWPYHSFLVEDPNDLRRDLTDALTARFKAKPDSITAYALICPVLYAGDEKKVAFYQTYLKANDPFLYKREQKNITAYWRKGIADELKDEDDTGTGQNYSPYP